MERKNYSLKDAFKALSELNEDYIETSVVVQGPLTESTFNLSDEKNLEDIEEFKKEKEEEQPELTVVDADAESIEEVTGNEDVAGSFLFTCNKCGENIFRSLDDLKTIGYEKVDELTFKLKNKDLADGEFYHCSKCGGDLFTGNKQIVLSDIDAEVTGKDSNLENSDEIDAEINDIVNADNDETNIDDHADNTEAEDIVVESKEKTLKKSKENLDEAVSEEDIDNVEHLSEDVAKVLDEAGIIYGDIVEYPENLKCNIVGVDEEEWSEAKEALEHELEVKVVIPNPNHDEFDDEIEVFAKKANDVFLEALSSDTIAKFKEHPFFKDFKESPIRKFIAIYLDFNNDADEKEVTPEAVYEFMSEEGLGLFALDNFDALRFLTFKQLAQKDPKFIEACIKFFPESGNPDPITNKINVIEYCFKDLNPEDTEKTINDIKKIYLNLDESLKKELKEGFRKIVDGQTFWSIDGENWEECTIEEYDSCGYEDVTEDEYDDIKITDIDEESLDKGICRKLSSMYENFASYKTEKASLDDKNNKIIIEGKLKFKSNKEQNVKFIFEAMYSNNPKITFKVRCEDFKDFNFEARTRLSENLLETIGITDGRKLNEEYDEADKTLEEYAPEDIPNLKYQIIHYNILDIDTLTNDIRRDYKEDADNYLISVCSKALWGDATSNDHERKLVLEYIDRNYPEEVHSIRQALGNSINDPLFDVEDEEIVE